MGRNPLWVYQHYGRPVLVQQESCCVFQGYKSNGDSRSDVLIHAYDLVAGGRLAFIYDQPANGNEWLVVGVAYDALDSTEEQRLTTFFPHGAPRDRRLFACAEADFYHHADGAITAPSLYALWNAGSGHRLYARYLTDGNLPKHYDPVGGRDVAGLPPNLDQYRLVQFAYFDAPARVMDMHMATDDDFSITNLYRNCLK